MVDMRVSWRSHGGRWPSRCWAQEAEHTGVLNSRLDQVRRKMKTADSQHPVGTTHIHHNASHTNPLPTPHSGEEPVPFRGNRGWAGQDTQEDINQVNLAGRTGGEGRVQCRTHADVCPVIA